MYVCVCVCVCANVCVCMCACERACMSARACVNVKYENAGENYSYDCFCDANPCETYVGRATEQSASERASLVEPFLICDKEPLHYNYHYLLYTNIVVIKYHLER